MSVMPYTSQQKQTKKRQMTWIIGGIVVVLVGLFFINQSTDKTSTIQISPTGGNSSVFIDRTQQKALQSTSNPTTYSVTSGSHQVLIAQDGYWPWSESVSVSDNETTTIDPFLIEETGRRVVQAETDIVDALAAAETQPRPSIENPVVSPNGDIQVFVDNETNIIAQWTAGTSSAPDYFNCRQGTCGVSVYNNQPVRQIAFYPNRNDVIFFSTNSGVFAIELNPKGETQNFQPVAESIQNPIFTLQNDRIYVSANGRIMVSDI